MIHILLRYLGIKTKMLNHIDEQINKLSNEGETLLDLFAGSNIVGQYFSNKRRTFNFYKHNIIILLKEVHT